MSTLENEIRVIDESLKNAKIKKLTVHKTDRAVDAEVICDKAVPDVVCDLVRKAVEKSLPHGFIVGEVTVSKILADGELVAKSVLEF